MRPTDTMRLLPWLSPDGKPCFLAGDGTGFVSRLADDVEAAQLDEAAELIEEARRVLDARTWTPGELHLLAVELTTVLANVRRVAESRGGLLPASDDDGPVVDDADDALDDGDEALDDGDRGGPRLPAEAFG
ncbi:hypothetical protein DY245_04965 [Streptomyces inhibens]|uniref:Uncharacterized protein n=1 Tax=Streptomyces inhibens TaxID=2293571 RepID=A0A371Q9N4_STRIH|nr:hypothetical protein [Streptomyces inhibens]REK91374.1 hypothetical protein DY245_04965 [Streptomyces inhibens]